MARIARVVVPGVPHHVTQRGVRRMETFFDEEDHKTFLALMRKCCRSSGIEIWAYCLMPNHIHLIAAPEHEGSLARGIGEAHRRYTRHINFKKGWKGYLWQGRFSSFPMNEDYLLAAARYIELNPVRANIAKQAQSYNWSSAKAHILGMDDELVSVKPMLDRVNNWTELLASGQPPETDDMRIHERTGRPLGRNGFIEEVSLTTGRDLSKKKPGPKRTENHVLCPLICCPDLCCQNIYFTKKT